MDNLQNIQINNSLYSIKLSDNICSRCIKSIKFKDQINSFYIVSASDNSNIYIFAIEYNEDKNTSENSIIFDYNYITKETNCDNIVYNDVYNMEILENDDNNLEIAVLVNNFTDCKYDYCIIKYSLTIKESLPDKFKFEHFNKLQSFENQVSFINPLEDYSRLYIVDVNCIYYIEKDKFNDLIKHDNSNNDYSYIYKNNKDNYTRVIIEFQNENIDEDDLIHNSPIKVVSSLSILDDKSVSNV